MSTFGKQKKYSVSEETLNSEETENSVLSEDKSQDISRKIEVTQGKSDVSVSKRESEEENVNEISRKKNWFEKEGQLVVDVYQTEDKIIIQAPLAGVESEDIDIAVENDMIIIRGKRFEPETVDGERKYFNQECFWGDFSRRLILPQEADLNRAEASLQSGILTIKIPIVEETKKKKIVVKG